MRVENDKKIFAAGYPAIVPFLMEEYRGEVSFEIYSGIRKEARLFEKNFQGRYFTEKALASLSASLDDYIEAHGYARDKKGATRYYYSYEAKDREAIDTSLIQDSTCLLTQEIAEKVRTQPPDFNELSTIGGHHEQENKGSHHGAIQGDHTDHESGFLRLPS